MGSGPCDAQVRAAHKARTAVDRSVRLVAHAKHAHEFGARPKRSGDRGAVGADCCAKAAIDLGNHDPALGPAAAAVENAQHGDVLLVRGARAPDDDMLVASHKSSCWLVV